MIAKAIIILLPLLLYFLIPSPSLAANDFIVTAFTPDRNFSWINGPTAGCSAINSKILTSPSNDPVTILNTCEATYGITDNVVPDGTYYIALNIGGTIVKSQVFTITNGLLIQQPTPTPTPVNQAPVAVAGTSLDANGNIQLDASSSSDSENDPLTYLWRIQGQGGLLSGEKVSVPTLPSGTYIIILTVNDGRSRSIDTIKIAIVAPQSKPTLKMSVKDIVIDKKDGSFLIRGEFDKKNALVNAIVTRPSMKIQLGLQTGGTATMPTYGVLGESILTLQTKERLLKN